MIANSKTILLFDDKLSFDYEGNFAYIEVLFRENKKRIRNINVSNDVGFWNIKEIILI